MCKLFETTDLCAGYKSGFDVVSQINLKLCQGEVLGIVGKNGCGKSTLAKTIVGLVPYRSGSISFHGQDIPIKMPIERMKSIGISIMLQGGRVFPNLSVWENFQLAAMGIIRKDLEQEIIDLIPLLHETKRGKLLLKGADKLSGGERHQLALAMTLAAGRDLIILDEPSAGLMPTAVDSLYDILHKVRDRFNSTIILIEQNVKQAEDFADQLAVMDNGRIIYQGHDIDLIEELMYK